MESLVSRQRGHDMEDDLVRLLGHDGVPVHDDDVCSLQDHPTLVCIRIVLKNLLSRVENWRI